jgi:FAD/FMN-containing dehydrogenase
MIGVGDEIRDFTGELLLPGDERYDTERKVWNGAIDRYPALIARAGCTADVVAMVRFARERDLPLSIRGGGHSAAGLAVADDAVMLDLSGMKSAEVNAADRTVRAAPGLRWDELDAATQARGLAVTGGVVGSTGIAGLTLGGGIGWLDRLAGLTCDNLLSAEVVTADGRILRASSAEHPDLLWALRGGGGNFGVVTSLRYRLHPVTEVQFLAVGYTLDHAADLLRAYQEFSLQAPDRLTLYASIATAPPAPFIPGHLHGQRVAVLLMIYFGPAGQARQAVRPLRAMLPRPAIDAALPMSYQQAQRISDAISGPGLHHYYTAEWLSRLDDQTIESLVTVAMAAAELSPRSLIAIKRMGGAVARVSADGTAFWYRNAAHNLDIHAQWAPGEDPAPHIAWARQARQAAGHVSAGGGYVNFLGSDQGSDRVRSAYGGNYRRLAEVKAAYDPDNFFRINHNIEPAHTSQRSGPPAAGS